MNRRVARLLTRLYPRRWRERYGAEFEELLRSGDGGFRTSANVVWSALFERLFPTQGRAVEQNPSSFGAMMKRPSAFIPVVMSLVALVILLGDIAIFGVVHEADEGGVAHIWQLLMAGQLPVLAFFAIKWLPRAPRQTLGVLALQAGAVLASMAPVYFLNL
jgi:hypothetical protein